MFNAQKSLGVRFPFLLARFIGLTGILWLWSVISVQADAQHHSHDSHEHSYEHDDHHSTAHVHGQAQLMLAIENNVVEIVFESPAINLMGFEHRAQSPEQKKRVQTVKKHLEDGQTLFDFIDGRCSLEQQTVRLSGMLNKPDAADSHTASVKDRKHHEGEAGHSGVKARYRFHCQRASAIRVIKMPLLERFQGIHLLNVQWVTASGQGAAILNQQQTQLQIN